LTFKVSILKKSSFTFPTLLFGEKEKCYQGND